MKTLQSKVIFLGLFSLLLSTLLPNQLFASGLESKNVPVGFWVIETQPNKKEAIVRYYTKEMQLIHIEKVSAKEVNLKRKGAIERLNSKALIFANMYKMLEEHQKVSCIK